MHIEDELIQRLLHGELPQADEMTVRRHLAECGQCSDRLDRARRDEYEVYALLGSVDHAAPHVDAAAVAAAARPRATPWVRWAATILLALGVAGAAYAIPGSPLRRWVRSLTHRARPAPQTPSPDSGLAGIAVAPGLDLTVRFTGPQPVGQIEVLLTDGVEVEVRAVIGAAMFSAGTDRLVVDNRDPQAAFEVRIPRTAPRVQILLGDARVMLKEGPRVVTEPSARCRSDAPARYVCLTPR